MESIKELFRQAGNLFRWWYIVAPWEQSIRVRLGKKVEVLNEGVHLRIPFADRVFIQSTRRRFLSLGTQTISTLDEKVITIGAKLGYEIQDIGKLYDTLHDAEDTLAAETAGMIARYINCRKIKDVKPLTIESYVAEHLNLTQYGLGSTRFFITDFAVVRTYRLIQSFPKDYGSGLPLTTVHAEGDPRL